MLAKHKRVPVSRFHARPLKIASGARLTLRYLGSADGEKRAAVLVPRGIAKNAVTRNRLRRLIFHALEAQWNELPPGDLVAVVKPGAARAAKEAFDEEVRELSKRINS